MKGGQLPTLPSSQQRGEGGGWLLTIFKHTEAGRLRNPESSVSSTDFSILPLSLHSGRQGTLYATTFQRLSEFTSQSQAVSPLRLSCDTPSPLIVLGEQNRVIINLRPFCGSRARMSPGLLRIGSSPSTCLGCYVRKTHRQCHRIHPHHSHGFNFSFIQHPSLKFSYCGLVLSTG